jgi:hypothetical protein
MASIIKADNIQKVSDGSNIIKKCGSTTTIGSGACSPIVICGSTVTLGRCGGTVTLASGATQTGFGQTYSAVEYCTTAKTSPFTAVAGTGYFINTTCGAVTVTLPATPSAGDIVAIKDYAGTFATNNITIGRNGSKIAGGCSADPILNQDTTNFSLIYVDATQGWLPLEDNTSSASGQSVYITATGGTITTCGDYKIHTFTSDGTFSVSAGAGPFAQTDYLVIAGGGGGGSSDGGGAGGGAGGYREAKTGNNGCYTTSPLATPIGLQMSVGSYPITVGGGGPGGSGPFPPGSYRGGSGNPSIFSTITSTGGGGAGARDATGPGLTGGSGGGGGANCGVGGSGNTPPVSPPQGNPGGNGTPGYSGGGGGGAGAVGGNATPTVAGSGGNGVTSSINTTPTTRAGGGGANSECGSSGSPGGTGGGGAGAAPGSNGGAGTVNTGSGGGGVDGNPPATGGAGGSGIVIIRYKFQ